VAASLTDRPGEAAGFAPKGKTFFRLACEVPIVQRIVLGVQPTLRGSWIVPGTNRMPIGAQVDFQKFRDSRHRL